MSPDVRPESLGDGRIVFSGPAADDLRLGGHGDSGGRLCSLTVLHAGVGVTTDETGLPGPAAEEARRAVLPALPQPAPPCGRSIAASTIWAAGRERVIEATAEAAAIGEQVVEVDGRPLAFTTASAGGVVGAVAVVDGATVTITAPAGAFPTALRRVRAADVAWS